MNPNSPRTQQLVSDITLLALIFSVLILGKQIDTLRTDISKLKEVVYGRGIERASEGRERVASDSPVLIKRDGTTSEVEASTFEVD